MPIFAAAVGAGADLIGGYWAADDQNAAYNRSRKGMLRGAEAGRKVLTQAGAQDALMFNLREAALKSSTKKRLGGFKGARNAVGLGGELAKQGVIARGKQNAAEVESSVVGQGLLGTSTGAQRLGQAKDLTSMQLASIDQQVSQAFADLGLQEAEVQGEGDAALAALLGQEAAGQQERYGALFGLEQISGDPGRISRSKERRRKLFGF